MATVYEKRIIIAPGADVTAGLLAVDSFLRKYAETHMGRAQYVIFKSEISGEIMVYQTRTAYIVRPALQAQAAAEEPQAHGD